VTHCSLHLVLCLSVSVKQGGTRPLLDALLSHIMGLPITHSPTCMLCMCLCAQDWDQTTVEWFSDSKETDIALPEYKLTFLWLDKTLACAVDQVKMARGVGRVGGCEGGDLPVAGQDTGMRS
jgi:hypothetical protein